MITGADLQAWGFKPGRWFKAGLAEANRLEAAGATHEAILAGVQALVPVEIGLRASGPAYGVFLDAGTDLERENLRAVREHMDELMRLPTVVAGAVMPDACPSGSQAGTIPVGGAVAAENAIHPGMHSADICCSVALTVFDRRHDPARLLDAVQAATHFGPGGRGDVIAPPADIMGRIAASPFLRGLETLAVGHFASQGDGNHFAYVGHLASTGQPALVTHHGSRGLGAQLYKRGMAAARSHMAQVAPGIPDHNAWIAADGEQGRAYWDALQTVRLWTRASHYAIHDRVAQALGLGIADRFWNEHNFVFRRTDGRYYHGKGATPSWAGFSADDDGRTLIPLNMAEPILIASHRDHAASLGFAPHGAGRNLSRTRHLREHAGALPAELAGLAARGLDIRSYCGVPDHSELPSAYKDAAAVRGQIERYGLAQVEDTVVPYGSIMAGDWERDAPWKKRPAGTAAT